MINTLSKINLSKIGWEGGRSTSIWIMSLNILFFLFWRLPLSNIPGVPQNNLHGCSAQLMQHHLVRVEFACTNKTYVEKFESLMKLKAKVAVAQNSAIWKLSF